MDLRWQSLRTRLVAGVLLATVLSLWSVTLVIGRYLRADMEAAISSQQFSAVSLIAAEIDRSVRERLDVLVAASGLVVANDTISATQAQRFLDNQASQIALFNWGILITDATGLAIASIPAELDRVGTNYGDLAVMRETIANGTPYVGEPLAGRRTGVPVFGMAVPIKGSQGQLLGVLMGVTNLQRPNFLDEISAAKYGRTGDFLVTAPKSRIFIASSDKERVMKPGPPPGVNALYDRYVAGEEGSGVAISSRGVEELSSSKRIPTTGWLMQSVLPTDEAFAPIRAVQRRLIIATVLLTVLASVVAWWWLRRQVRPLEEAARLLDDMRAGTLPRQALPIHRMDEIGRLANAFNGLLEVIAAQEAQEAENAANRRLRKVLANVPGMVFQYRLHADGSGSFPFASEAVRAIYEVSPEELETNADKIRSMLHPDDKERFFRSLHGSAETLQPWRIDYRIVAPSGQLKWLRVDAVPEKDRDELITWCGFVTEVTSTKTMEAELRIAATTFESQEGIFITDAKGVILRVNRAFARITGYADSEVVGRTPAILRSGRHDQEFYRRLRAALTDHDLWQGEIWNRRKNGDIFPEWLTISAVKDGDGRTTHYVAAFSDITEHKKSEERIHHLAFFDPLTNLPNRRLLIDRIRQATVTCQRSRQYGAIAFLDLDHFKILNDTKGHDVGDELLKQTALRLAGCLREGDTVARLGGDEFVVLLHDLGQDAREAAAMAETVAEKLRLAIGRPFDLGGYAHLLSASIGITLFEDKQSGVDVLLKQADLALYQAKAAGRNSIRFFDPAMQRQLDERAALEAGLREALRAGHLVLHYQPQVNALGRLIGVEALLRWIKPDGRSVMPNDFIPLAEETGLILPVGQWVLEAAGAQLQAWSSNPGLAGLTLAINVSPRQFAQPEFIANVQTVIARYGIGPGSLQLELTENVVLGNVNEAITRMRTLKALGITFSLDDFGTGYSSLSYLKRLPIDQLKIDQEFVRDIVQDADDAAIVEAIIGLGRTLDLAVIAEGVETEEQRSFLRGCACGAYQGYLVGRPMPVADFEAFVLKRPG